MKEGTKEGGGNADNGYSQARNVAPHLSTQGGGYTFVSYMENSELVNTVNTLNTVCL